MTPGGPAGNAAPGAPTPKSPSPEPGVGDVPPGTTQPCHPQDSVPLPRSNPVLTPKLSPPGKSSRGGLC